MLTICLFYLQWFCIYEVILFSQQSYEAISIITPNLPMKKLRPRKAYCDLFVVTQGLELAN